MRPPTLGRPRAASYYEADDFNMQIEQVRNEFFLDKWAGGGWKNIAVFQTYDEALSARAALQLAILARRKK